MPKSPTTDAYRWTLPWVAGLSVNHIYRKLGRRIVLSAAAQAWRDDAIIQIRQDVIGRGSRLNLPPGYLSFHLDAYPPNHRTTDPDNLCKLVIDSVFAAFGTVDSRVRRVSSTMHEPSETPRLVVRIESWNEEAKSAT